MTPLSNCQALQYALIPGMSEDFEKIAKDQDVLAITIPYFGRVVSSLLGSQHLS